jgi:hypothetical protein
MLQGITVLAKRNKSWLIRRGVALAAVCAMPLVGVLMNKFPPEIIVAAFAIPFAVFAVTKWLELGFVAMLLAAFLVRFRIPTGTDSEIVVSLMICAGCLALWILHMLVEEKRLAIKPAATNVPLLGFIATVAISWIWSRAFRDPLVHEAGHPLVSVAAGMVIIMLPVCFLLVANNIRNIRWLQVLVGVLLLEGLVVLLLDIGSSFGIGAIQSISRFLGTNAFIHINSHGLLSMWCLSFALALALFNRRLHWIWTVLLAVYAIGWIYWGFILHTSWLSGWVPAFAAAAVVIFMRSKKLFVIALLILVIGAGGYYYQTAFESETQESGHTRLAAYAVNWRVTGKHLLFGTGPAGYASYYMSYFPTEAMASHSNYIDILAQTGIIGSTFFLWFFGAQVWSSYKLGRHLQNRGDFAEGLSAAVLGGTAGCVLAMALGDWLTPFAYTQGIIGFDMAMINWFFMGTLWALRHTLRSPQKESADANGAIA